MGSSAAQLLGKVGFGLMQPASLSNLVSAADGNSGGGDAGDGYDATR